MVRMEPDCQCGRVDSPRWFCRSQPASSEVPVGFPACPVRSRNNRPVSSLKEQPALAASGRYPLEAHVILIKAIKHPLVWGKYIIKRFVIAR